MNPFATSAAGACARIYTAVATVGSDGVARRQGPVSGVVLGPPLLGMGHAVGSEIVVVRHVVDDEEFESMSDPDEVAGHQPTSKPVDPAFSGGVDRQCD